MIIRESRVKFIVRANGDNYTFSANKKSDSTFCSVYPKGNGRYDVVTLAKGAKKYTSEVIAARVSYAHDPNIYTEAHKFIYDGLLRFRLGIDYDFSKAPQVFQVQNVDLPGLHRAMEKVGIDRTNTASLFGEVSQEEDADFVQYRGAKLYFASKPTRQTFDLVTNAIDELYTLLNKHNLGHLVDGVYRIGKVSGKTAGYYHYSDHSITLDLPLLRKGAAIPVLVHELGHKWDGTTNMSDIIRAQYIGLAKAGHTFKGEANFNTGDEVIIKAGAPKTMTNVPLKVLLPADARRAGYSMEPGKIALVNTATERVSIAHLSFFANPDAVTMADGSPVPFTNSDPWFPTKYATTKPEEFFAELFVQYIYDRLDGEPLEWMEGLKRK